MHGILENGEWREISTKERDRLLSENRIYWCEECEAYHETP